MKVLHVGPKNYPPAHGGVERVVFDIVSGTDFEGNYIFVEWPQEETSFVKVLPRGFRKQFFEIKSFCKKNKISVIHFHKEAFALHAIFSSLFLRKSLITFHGCAWRIKRWAWYYRAAFYLLDIFACCFVSKVVFVGKEDWRHFSKIIFWRKLHYVPNGIEINTQVGVDDTSKCVFIGRISPEKNILKMIQLFGNDERHLTIYGPFDKHDPYYKDQVLSEIEKNGAVEYGGVLPYDRIIPTLANYNTFYNLSFSEGMPVSVLEAASVGLNLVLSSIPQHQDLNFPDVHYLNPNSPSLSFAFNGISRKNKEYAASNYSLEQTVDNYKNLYLSLHKKRQHGKSRV